MFQDWGLGANYEGGLLGKKREPGLLNFIQSPEALALASGLLQAAEPSFNSVPSLAGGFRQGFQNMQKVQEAEAKRRLAEAMFGLKNQEFGLEKEKHGLNVSKYDFEKQKLIEAQARRAAIANALGFDILGSSNDKTADVISPANVLSEPVKNWVDPYDKSQEGETIEVKDPRINNGEKTRIAATLNGRKLSEKEAIDIALAKKREREILEKNKAQIPALENSAAQPAIAPIQATPSTPNSVIAPQMPTASDSSIDKMITLPNGYKVLERNWLKAKGLWAAGKDAEAIKALYEEPDKTTYSDLTKLINERNKLKAINPNSPDLALYDTAIQRKAEGSPGIELSVGPNGEITFSQGGSSKASRGPQIVKDSEGKDVFVTPQTPASQDRQHRRATAANELKRLEAVRQPYRGEGSIAMLRGDINKYKSTQDPQEKAVLRERLINTALADMLVPEMAILNTLVTSKEGVTETDIKHQREVLKRGWPETLHYELNNLPADLYDEIDTRYRAIQQSLSDVAAEIYSQGAPVKMDKKNPYEDISDEELDRRIAEAEAKKNGR